MSKLNKAFRVAIELLRANRCKVAGHGEIMVSIKMAVAFPSVLSNITGIRVDVRKMQRGQATKNLRLSEKQAISQKKKKKKHSRCYQCNSPRIGTEETNGIEWRKVENEYKCSQGKTLILYSSWSR